MLADGVEGLVGFENAASFTIDPDPSVVLHAILTTSPASKSNIHCAYRGVIKLVVRFNEFVENPTFVPFTWIHKLTLSWTPVALCHWVVDFNSYFPALATVIS